MSIFWAILGGWAAMAIVMAVLWWVQRRTGDAGIVDVAWSLGVAAIGGVFAWVSEGDVTRRWLVVILATVWAVRLSGYVLTRVLSLPEDGRYQSLKEQWGERAQANIFRFYQYQAFGCLLFALPLLVACQNPLPISFWDFLACGVGVASILGEMIADAQLARFRRENAGKRLVCRMGLWRYSRHPNYFFEWLHWWAYVFFAAPTWWVAPALLGPLTMWFVITRVTGIPPTEQQALKSRGDAYRDYQRTTSAFFPWPPKSAAA